MTNQRQNDESLILDALRNELDDASARQLQQRIAQDPALQQLRQDIQNSLSALNLLPECEPPADLAAKTLARIRQVRQTDALIAREETGRSGGRSTFSLREAIAIAACTLLVVTLFVPSVRQARRTAQMGQCASNVGQIGSAMLTYANSNTDRLPIANGQQRRWLPGDGPAVSNSTALFKLVRSGYAPQVIFMCPSSQSGQPFEVAAGMNDFPSERNIHYSYQHTVGNGDLVSTDPSLRPVTSNMAILADQTPFYRNGLFQPQDANNASSENHGKTGENVLYLDMHAQWSHQPSVGVAGNNIFLAEGIYNYRGDETPVSPTDSFLLPAWSGPAEKSNP